MARKRIDLFPKFLKYLNHLKPRICRYF